MEYTLLRTTVADSTNPVLSLVVVGTSLTEEMDADILVSME
jgi:hypothetical protein